MARRVETSGVVGLALSLLLGGAAHGDFVGLTAVLEFPSAMTLNGPRDVYHVFAEFSDPADRVNTWFGSAASPFVIQNVLADNITLGAGFTNFGGPAGTLPPEQQGFPNEWDTFATIGIRFATEGAFNTAINISPGFPQFISGNSLTSADASVALSPMTSPQGRADYRVAGGDTHLRVLLMQLTVNVGEHVRGTLNAGGQLMTPAGYQDFTAFDQTFNSVPAPGALLIFATGGLASRPSRRRRNIA